MARNPFAANAVGIDLGSDHMRVCVVQRGGEVHSMPTRLATERGCDSILAVGEHAARMTDRTPPSISIHSPVRRGFVTHPEQAGHLLRRLLTQTRMGPRVFGPPVVLALSPGASSVQRHAVVATTRAAGAGRVSLVSPSLAAAVGSGLPAFEAGASLIIDLGAQKTEIGVLSLGGVVVGATVEVGGDEIRDAIALHLRREHHMLIGRPTADAIKYAVARPLASDDIKLYRAKGQDARSRRPAAVEIKSSELVAPIRAVLGEITEALRDVLDRTPPELSADLSETGLFLTGGGSRLHGIAEFFSRSVGLPVECVPEPEFSVVLGCRHLAARPELLRELGSMHS